MKDFENSRHSLYMDVYNELKNDIIMGKYPAGSILPTELELSESFFVSRITVQKAMQLLKKEGYISRTPGRGTFVEISPQSRNSISWAWFSVILLSASGCRSSPP